MHIDSIIGAGRDQLSSKYVTALYGIRDQIQAGDTAAVQAALDEDRSGKLLRVAGPFLAGRAVVDKQHEFLRSLLAAGVSPNAVYNLRPLVVHAAATDNVDALRILADAGADLRARPQTAMAGGSAIVAATDRRAAGAIEFLRERGVDLAAEARSYSKAADAHFSEL
jgi:DNA-binding LacI/PurR family transcriptional regulator